MADANPSKLHFRFPWYDPNNLLRCIIVQYLTL